METLGEYIIRLRKEKGLSQRRLAQLSDMANTTIQRIEEDNTKTPSIDTLRKLESALSLEVGELIEKAYSDTTIKLSRENLPDDLKDIKIEYLKIAKKMQDQEVSTKDFEEILNFTQKMKKN